MPRYYALDTAVKLCVWDPHAPKAENEVENTSASLASASMKNNGLPRPKKKETSGPAIHYVLDDLTEEYFKGHEGVDFIAGTPFYLVKAGKELFEAGEEDAGQSSHGFKDASLMTASSTVLANATEYSHPSSQVSTVDSSLSSIDTEFFTPKGSFTAAQQGESSDPQVVDVVRARIKPLTPRNDSQNEAVRKPITSPKPITISVDLSRKSFMPSLFTSQRQELCITIFYNGELTQSRILRPTTLSNPNCRVGGERYQFYSGRRIESFIEVPWVVRPHVVQDPSRNASSIAQSEPTIREFEERWNRTNQILLAEANEWGLYGMFRSPIGEYLEELSKRAIPEFKANGRFRGAQAGIIDVVITLGRSVSTAVSGLREPRRKLHEDRTGKERQLVIAPEELRPNKKAKLVANFNRGTSRSSISQSQNKLQQSSGMDATDRSHYGGKRPGYTVPFQSFKSINQSHTSATSNNPPTPSISNDHKQDGPSEVQEGVTPFGMQSLKESNTRGMTMSLPSPSRIASLPITSSPLAHHNTLAKPFPVPVTVVREHPNKPKNIAQKRYKGTESPGSEPSPKRPRLMRDLKRLQDVSFDPEIPTSASTRSKRSTSSPVVPSTNLGHSFTGDQRVRRSKLANAPTVNLAANPSPDTVDSPTVPITSRSLDNEHSSQDSVELMLTSTPVSNDKCFPTAEMNAPESVQTTSGFPLASDFRPRNDSMSFGLDGSTDVPRRATRPRSSTESARSRVSFPQSASESVAETHATSVNQFAQGDSTVPGHIARIVFDIKDTEASSARVDRERFEGLQLPGFTTENGTQELPNSKEAGQKSAFTPFVQKNKFVTENHPSVKARRKAEAAAAAASQNATSSTEVAATSNLASAKKSAPKRKRKPGQDGKPVTSGAVVPSVNPAGNITMGGESLLQPKSGASMEKVGGKTLPVLSEATYETESVGGKTVFMPQSKSTIDSRSVGGKTILTPQSESTDDRAFVGGKTVFLPPAPPYKKQRKSNPGGSARKVSNAPLEASNDIELPPKTQSKLKRRSTSSEKLINQTPEAEEIAVLPKTKSKPRSGSASSKKRGNTVSEESEKPRTQSRGKRDSVSSRELEGLFSDHKLPTAVDASFSALFKETTKKARPSRKMRRVYTPTATSGDEKEDEPSEFQLKIASASDEVFTTVSRKISASRKKPVFQGLLMGSSDKAPQIDNATEKFLQEVIRPATSAYEESLTTDRTFSPSRKAPIFPNFVTSSDEANQRHVHNATSNHIQAPSQRERTSSTSSSTSKLNDAASSKLPKAHVWPVAAVASSFRTGKRNRSELETEEAPKEAPAPVTQRNGLLNQSAPAPRTSRGYSVDSEGKKIPTPRKDSLSTFVGSAPNPTAEETKIPKISTASSRKVPAGTWLRLNEAHGTESNNPSKPKISVSEILTFSTPATSTTPRGKASTAAPQRHGGGGVTASAANVAALLSTPKVSVSNDTITFRTPAPTAAPSTQTHVSHLRSRNKRKATEISSPSGDNGSTSGRFWKPTSLCDGSVLGYASGDAFPGTNIDPLSKNVCRNIKAEREGVFRASGVLMGVRFVVGLV